LPIVADLSDPGCDRAGLVGKVAAELGPVDIIVNNAAACFYLPSTRPPSAGCASPTK
jgi:NAD(P)-dependent dehydrogenase (short-subunit alcohol dehydrogenase family)